MAHLPIAPSAAPSPETRGKGGEDQRRVLTLLCLHGHSRHDRHSARAHDGGWVSGACASRKHVGRPLLGPAHEMGWVGQETGGRRPTSTKKSILVLVPCSPDRGGFLSDAKLSCQSAKQPYGSKYVNQHSCCKGREGAAATVRIGLIRRGRAKSSPRRPATPRSGRAATGRCSRTAHLAGRPSKLMRGFGSVEELPAEPQRRRDRLPS